MDTPMLIVPETVTDHQPASPRTRRIPRFTFRLMLSEDDSPQPASDLKGYVYHAAGRWWLNARAVRPYEGNPRHEDWIDEEIDPAAAAELARLMACLGVAGF